MQFGSGLRDRKRLPIVCFRREKYGLEDVKPSAVMKKETSSKQSLTVEKYENWISGDAACSRLGDVVPECDGAGGGHDKDHGGHNIG